jgi:hypothetical protein
LVKNTNNGEYGLKQVVHLFRYQRDTIYTITVGTKTIEATADHPFFIGGKWLKVQQLKVGDSVVTYSGNKLAITSIQQVAKPTIVYNFEVADFHTYYVSPQKVLVHNSGPCDVKVPKVHANATSGNNAAAQRGKEAHKEFSNKVKQKGNGWNSESDASFRGKDGKTYRPDARILNGDYIELKPNTPRGRSRGASQIKKYQAQHPNSNVKFRVVYYNP